MKYIKTEAGQKAFKERSPLFSTRQRSQFILFDGNKTDAQVLTATAGLGASQTDIDQMVAHGFLSLAAAQAVAGAASQGQNQSQPHLGEAAVLAKQADKQADRSEQDRYKDAKPLATQLTAGLGLRGFRLNLSVESAGGYRELLALLPKIQDAVGTRGCRELEMVLKG